MAISCIYLFCEAPKEVEEEHEEEEQKNMYAGEDKLISIKNTFFMVVYCVCVCGCVMCVCVCACVLSTAFILIENYKEHTLQILNETGSASSHHIQLKLQNHVFFGSI